MLVRGLCSQGWKCLKIFVDYHGDCCSWDWSNTISVWDGAFPRLSLFGLLWLAWEWNEWWENHQMINLHENMIKLQTGITHHGVYESLQAWAGYWRKLQGRVLTPELFRSQSLFREGPPDQACDWVLAMLYNRSKKAAIQLMSIPCKIVYGMQDDVWPTTNTLMKKQDQHDTTTFKPFAEPFGQLHKSAFGTRYLGESIQAHDIATTEFASPASARVWSISSRIVAGPPAYSLDSVRVLGSSHGCRLLLLKWAWTVLLHPSQSLFGMRDGGCLTSSCLQQVERLPRCSFRGGGYAE